MSVTNNHETETIQYKLRLFVAGDAPNSRIARENLKSIQARICKSVSEIEVVDVMNEPEKALQYEIYVTPALQIIKSESITIIFGNLSDSDSLIHLCP
ncbi:MAG: hypothetical protein HQK74_05700 [Desulfamplus sp.]|nr:hypothetical protein [Desulfamplus sp.]